MGLSGSLYFATSGIRGRANTEISPELAFNVGKNIAGWIEQNYPDQKDKLVCIGYDNRRNSKFLAYCTGAAITSRGIDVKISENPIPTPFLIFATLNNKAQAGLMVTGSHLPEYDNGLILIDGFGNYFKGELNIPKEELVSWEELGKLRYINYEEREYFAFFSLYISQVMLEPMNLKILIDPAHGVMKKYLHMALAPMVKEIVKVNWDDDDTFSGRISEPSETNLQETRTRVLENNCDLGIATDMDGDRVIFITKSGKIISGDYIGALFASYVWKKDPKQVVIAPINTSAIISHVAEQMNGNLIFSRVGPPSIIEAIRDNKASFGFEESGKYIFVKTAIWPDSALSAIKLLSILQQSGKTLDEIMAEFPEFHAVKTKIPFPRTEKIIFDTQLRNIIQQKVPNFEEINDLDGYRINFADNSWMMLRLSGTEDYVRIFTEHESLEESEKLNKIGHQIIDELKKLLS